MLFRVVTRDQHASRATTTTTYRKCDIFCCDRLFFAPLGGFDPRNQRYLVSFIILYCIYSYIQFCTNFFIVVFNTEGRQRQGCQKIYLSMLPVFQKSYLETDTRKRNETKTNAEECRNILCCYESSWEMYSSPLVDVADT